MKNHETQYDVINGAAIDTGRRSAMRKIAVGVGVLAGISVLPERWTRPIIGEIVLPAHAQTSGLRGSFANTINVTKIHSPTEKLMESLARAADSVVDFVVADANASMTYPNYICVTLLDGGAATAILGYAFQNMGSGYFGGTGTVAAGVVVSINGTSFTITFTSVSASSVKVVISAAGYNNVDVTLTPGASCPSASDPI